MLKKKRNHTLVSTDTEKASYKVPPPIPAAVLSKLLTEGNFLNLTAPSETPSSLPTHW